MKLLLILLCLGALPFAVADSRDRAPIDRLLDGFHQAAASADFDDYFDRFTDDAWFLGTDASERWSVASFRAYARPRFTAGGGWRYQVQERNIVFGQEDETAWFDEILLNESLGRCRGSGVVVRTADGWKVAYYSLTLLIPNAIAEEVGRQSMAADDQAR